MIISEYKNITIGGLACCVPKQTVKTMEYAERFGQDKVKKFIKMTGVRETHRSVDKQTASDLAFIAADELLEKKNTDRKEIGALLFVTETPDYITPSTAFVLQYRLGLPIDSICFDINLGCSGFVSGLNTLMALMNSSNIEKGLLLFGDTMTKKLSPEDRSIYMLLGDAGGAVLLEKKDNAASISTVYRSDGGKYDMVIIPAGGSRFPDADKVRVQAVDGNIRGPYDFYMDGANIFFFSTSDASNLVREYLKEKEKKESDYDALVLHQANELIMKTFAKRVGFPMEKVPSSIEKFGNTVGSCIPLTIANEYAERRQGKLKLLMSGFGVGLSWGVVDAEIDCSSILPLLYSDDYFIKKVEEC